MKSTRIGDLQQRGIGSRDFNIKLPLQITNNPVHRNSIKMDSPACPENIVERLYLLWFPGRRSSYHLCLHTLGYNHIGPLFGVHGMGPDGYRTTTAIPLQNLVLLPPSYIQLCPKTLDFNIPDMDDKGLIEIGGNFEISFSIKIDLPSICLESLWKSDRGS